MFRLPWYQPVPIFRKLISPKFIFLIYDTESIEL